jgi:NADPH-dependent 2,4-dienoyl-CoA reductase/sulfur reductase-like enzyme
MTADAAVQGTREIDPDGSIGVVAPETGPPYDRPPLRKALWKGKPFKSIWRGTGARGAELHLGRKFKALICGQNRQWTTVGEVYVFDKVLLATGGTPRRLSFGEEPIIYFRTLDDYRGLRALGERGRTFAVIGGGFIGSELAAALALKGKEVVTTSRRGGSAVACSPPELARLAI